MRKAGNRSYRLYDVVIYRMRDIPPVLRVCMMVVLLTATHLRVSAQMQIRMDSTTMSLGSKNVMYLSVALPYDSIAGPDMSQVTESIPQWRTLDEGRWKRISSTTWQRDLSFAIYDTGRFVLPILAVYGDKGLAADTLLGHQLQLQVRYAGDAGAAAEIREIYERQWSLLHALKYLAVIIGVVLLIVAVWKVVKRYTSSEPELAAEKVIPEEPAHVIALRELQRLEEQRLWEGDAYKEHQTRLSMITRRYLQRRYGIPAPESTTSEIIRQLRPLGLRSEQTSRVTELLQLADMVKYAKAVPPTESHRQLLADARRFVTETQLDPSLHTGEEE